MHLKAHKLVLVALLLFGIGLLVGTNLGNVYRRHAREKAFAPPSTLNGNHQGKTDPENINGEFPRQVGGMARRNLLTGAEAEEFVYSYLGRHWNLTRAYIATYKDNDREAVIFVADFSNPFEAGQVLEAMKKTLQEQEGFHECSEKQIFEDVPVNYLLDDKNSHYYFAKGNRVLWLMVGPEEDIEVLLDVYLYF